MGGNFDMLLCKVKSQTHMALLYLTNLHNSQVSRIKVRSGQAEDDNLHLILIVTASERPNLCRSGCELSQDLRFWSGCSSSLALINWIANSKDARHVHKEGFGQVVVVQHSQAGDLLPFSVEGCA